MGVWIVVAIGVVVVIAMSLLTARLRSVQGAVDDAWQQVLLALRRRRGLAVELAAAVRTGSDGEIDMIDRVREASQVADLPGASPEQQDEAERDLETALAELSHSVTASPRLLEDAEVTALRRRIDDTDRRIQARRADHERCVDALRRRTSSVPGRWIAHALGIEAAPFQVDE